MEKKIIIEGLQVTEPIHLLLKNKILPGTGISLDYFYKGLTSLLKDLCPQNEELLKKRDEFQLKIDQWHKDRSGEKFDKKAYEKFLTDIKYILPEPEDFTISTKNVDREISEQPGPQLVVPVKNTRFALNAANARWGSLYDALYGTDVIPENEETGKDQSYNLARGEKVIAYGRRLLDEIAPLKKGKHAEVVTYGVTKCSLVVGLADGSKDVLLHPEKFKGYQGNPKKPSSILLENNGLRVEIAINRKHFIGKNDAAGVKDIIMEAAVTTIMDCEDSVAAVDSEDKAEIYRNWCGLMQGDLVHEFTTDDNTVVTRQLNPERIFTAPDDSSFRLKGRGLLLVRNVGLLMKTEAILDSNGQAIPEGILDAMMTAAGALKDINKYGSEKNSRYGSIYIVKPKMHGPEEVAFTCRLFERVEDALNIPLNTLKLGIMDEERRTTLNLKACIYEARERVAFINTGFLDRTGDEIHTLMHAGPMVKKSAMKSTIWLDAYETGNVMTGLLCHLQGKAQIGKGMWAKPDNLLEMLEEKEVHPLSGANTAWVPSPNAATIHSIHYQRINVKAQQKNIIKKGLRGRDLNALLTLPLLEKPETLTPKEIQQELDNNVQGLLGYVLGWVENGIGCSKIPDIHNVNLMEDRATLRISSQHIANWLLHGILTKKQVLKALKDMAEVVNAQNKKLPEHKRLTESKESFAFQAASDLIFKAYQQANGYTEPILHAYRRIAKQNGR